MTYPLGPVAVPDLAGTIRATTPDAAVLRIGRVTAYDAGKITVNISDSNVLVEGAYLFDQYKAVLGDIVVVLKQTNQWFILGAPSAAPSDNVLSNYSFEEGEEGSAPPSWGRFHDPSSTATASFTTEPVRLGHEVDGPKALRLSLAATGVFQNSDDYVYSEPFSVVPGEAWTAACHVLGEADGPDDGLTAYAAISFTWHANAVDVYPTFVSQSTVINTYVSGKLPWTLLRTPGAPNGILVPDDVAFGRILLRSGLVWDNSISSVPSWALFWDRVIARRVS
jgi:hypothetical protein